jgi:hypothetical protein
MDLNNISKEQTEELMALGFKGSELLGQQVDIRQRIREQWKLDAGDLLELHQMAFSIVAKQVFRKQGIPGKTSANIDARLSLIVAFIHGVDICETAISEGLYLQAATLLKQEMETVTALDELLTDRRRNRRTPNVGNARFRWMKEVYNELNSAAHVADRDVLKGVVSRRSSPDLVGACLHPPYNKGVTFYMYGLQILLITILALQIAQLHEEMYGEKPTPLEERGIVIIQRKLHEAGWLKYRDDLEAQSKPSPKQ